MIVLLVLAPGFGLLVELALRPVQRLGEAEKLVMTIALLSALIALARWIWDPNGAAIDAGVLRRQAGVPHRLGHHHLASGGHDGRRDGGRRRTCES